MECFSPKTYDRAYDAGLRIGATIEGSYSCFAKRLNKSVASQFVLRYRPLSTDTWVPADGYADPKTGSLVYDDFGNRTSGLETIGTGEEASDLSYSYVYQLDNKLASRSVSTGGSPSTTNYTYDAMGQQTSDGTDSYAYSEMGNMVSGAYTLYYYDGDGVIRRKKSSVPNADDYYYYGATGLMGSTMTVRTVHSRAWAGNWSVPRMGFSSSKMGAATSWLW